MRKYVIVFLAVTLSASASASKPPVGGRRLPISLSSRSTYDIRAIQAPFTFAAANTTVLYSARFDVGGTCSPMGWTAVDKSAQTGDYWHVEDYEGLPFGPLSGNKSMWCGARGATTPPLCSYATLPGYGNHWDQALCTRTCIPVAGPLDVAFQCRIDTDVYPDRFVLETNVNCSGDEGWTLRDYWSGTQEFGVSNTYSVNAPQVRVRLRFQSGANYSDEDGYFDSHAGAVHIDSLIVENLPVEDFEDETVGATESNDYVSCHPPAFGAYWGLFRGNSLVQQDPCVRNLSCVWAAIEGSMDTYACGGFPQQPAVPRDVTNGEYIDSYIMSPPIPLSGTGSRVNFEFSVYRDLGLDNLIFYTWSVRSIAADGCPGPWRDYGHVYYGTQKDWLVSAFDIGSLLDFSAPMFQVRLGVEDWCGYILWECGCPSHAPLFDYVRICRVDVSGPTFTTRDFDMFQDTFPADGSSTGVGRADCAMNLIPYNSPSPTIQPGDSVFFTCIDPLTAVPGENDTGLADDPNGGKQVYCFVHVLDDGEPSDTKTGALLSDDPLHYPFDGTTIAMGKTWTRIQCELLNPAPPVPVGRFRVDLNDSLFEAGDVIEFFFGATNTLGQTSYCSGSALTYVQSDLNVAAEMASEFSIFPSLKWILYVDGMDGRGSQPYWDTAFDQLGLLRYVDRYDVRGPSSRVGNRPASRVIDVTQQLLYFAILWDTGDLSVTLGDGTANTDKPDDYAMLSEFLYGLQSDGGVYICGDDAPSSLASASGTSAMTFRNTYIPFTLTTGNHRPIYGINPLIVGASGPLTAFTGDAFVAAGSCPLLNDFDVMTPVGASISQMYYGAQGANNVAVLSKETASANPIPAWSTVILSGFSFSYIRDDEVDGVLDRADHLGDILTYVGLPYGPPSGAGVEYVTALKQNYPNPFNPQTTIAFSISSRSNVRIDVFNVAGQHVRALLDETRAAGTYTDVSWDGTDAAGTPVASGMYFYRLVAGQVTQTKKMVLLK